MTQHNATATFLLALAADNAAPGWVQLLPAGPDIQAREGDGRAWTLRDAQGVIDAFRRDGGPLVIDYEHASAIRAPEGGEAPAAGWITALELREGAIWGQVEWTERAASLVAAREYRFISPEFQHTKSGEILRIVAAGLVNRPAFSMTALSRAETSERTTPMNLTAICRALGLVDGASEDQILGAIDKLKDENKTALARAEQPDLERFVPRADYDQVKGQLDEASTALASMKTAQQDASLEQAIASAVAAGKIAPASRDHYRALCAGEGGLAKFEQLVGTLPVIGAPSRLDGKRPGESDAAITENQSAICKAMGLDETAFAKASA